jgi:hypothetical protein
MAVVLGFSLYLITLVTILLLPTDITSTELSTPVRYGHDIDRVQVA